MSTERYDGVALPQLSTVVGHTRQMRTLWPSGLTPDQWREWFLDLDPPAQYDAAAAVLAQTPPRQADADRMAAYTKGWGDGLAELRLRLEALWTELDDGGQDGA